MSTPSETVIDQTAYDFANTNTEAPVTDAERIAKARRVLLDAAANGRTAHAELDALRAIVDGDVSVEPIKRMNAVVARVASLITTLTTTAEIGSRANLADDGLSDLGCN